MDAKTLPQLRADLRAAEAGYRTALRHYFAAHVDRRDATVLRAHTHVCRVCGAELAAALDALIAALWHSLDDEACAAEQRRHQARRALLAAELRMFRQ